LELLECLYWGGVEGEGGAARDEAGAPWPSHEEDEEDEDEDEEDDEDDEGAGLGACDGEWAWLWAWRGRGWGCGAGVGPGERSRAYTLARGPWRRSQCFSKAWGFTTWLQWLHTTR